MLKYYTKLFKLLLLNCFGEGASEGPDTSLDAFVTTLSAQPSFQEDIEATDMYEKCKQEISDSCTKECCKLLEEIQAPQEKTTLNDLVKSHGLNAYQLRKLSQYGIGVTMVNNELILNTDTLHQAVLVGSKINNSSDSKDLTIKKGENIDVSYSSTGVITLTIEGKPYLFSKDSWETNLNIGTSEKKYYKDLLEGKK